MISISPDSCSPTPSCEAAAPSRPRPSTPQWGCSRSAWREWRRGVVAVAIRGGVHRWVVLSKLSGEGDCKRVQCWFPARRPVCPAPAGWVERACYGIHTHDRCGLNWGVSVCLGRVAVVGVDRTRSHSLCGSPGGFRDRIRGTARALTMMISRAG